MMGAQQPQQQTYQQAASAANKQHTYVRGEGYTQDVNFEGSEYPRWKYHVEMVDGKPEQQAKKVQNPEEEKALGEGWYNSPREAANPRSVRREQPRTEETTNETQGNRTQQNQQHHQGNRPQGR